MVYIFFLPPVLSYHECCVIIGSLLNSDPFYNKIEEKILTAHRSNIFSAKFLPGCSDQKIISCAGDGTIIYTGMWCTWYLISYDHLEWDAIAIIYICR